MTQTFQWTRLAVVSLTDDVDSSDLLYEFTEQAQSNNITILKSLLYNSATADFSATILETLSLQPEIILVIMKPNTAAPFLEQAYSLGLLSTGVTILGPSYLADASLFSSFSATAPVQSIMKGFIGLSPQM